MVPVVSSPLNFIILFHVLVVETYFMLCVRVKGRFTGFIALCVLFFFTIESREEERRSDDVVSHWHQCCDAARKQSRCLCDCRHLNQESLCFALICERCVINKVYFVSDVCVACCCSSPLQPQDGGDDVNDAAGRRLGGSLVFKTRFTSSVFSLFLHRFSYKGLWKTVLSIYMNKSPTNTPPTHTHTHTQWPHYWNLLPI